jgi:hypothetical protein
MRAPPSLRALGLDDPPASGKGACRWRMCHRKAGSLGFPKVEASSNSRNTYRDAAALRLGR